MQSNKITEPSRYNITVTLTGLLRAASLLNESHWTRRTLGNISISDKLASCIRKYNSTFHFDSTPQAT